MIVTFLYYGYKRHCKLQQNQHEGQVGVLGWYENENSQLPGPIDLGCGCSFGIPPPFLTYLRELYGDA